MIDFRAFFEITDSFKRVSVSTWGIETGDYSEHNVRDIKADEQLENNISEFLKGVASEYFAGY